MIYLLFAIIFSSLFPISFKIGAKINYNPVTTIFFNFIFGSLLSFLTYFIFLYDNINYHDVLIVFIIGIPTGIIYFLGLLLYQKAISQSGISIAALFMKISLIIPVILSIIFFYERPSNIQYIGILLAIFSIIILNGGIKNFSGLTPTLLTLFFIAGLGDFSNKIYEQFGNINYRSLFIFFNFTTAAILSFYKDKTIIKRNINKKNIILGFFIGTINALTTYFIVLTLSVLPASIALVIMNITVIILVSLVGFIIFKEKFKRKEYIAFLISLISILLISL